MLGAGQTRKAAEQGICAVFPGRDANRDLSFTRLRVGEDIFPVFRRSNGQVALSELTARHCNFQIFGGETTATYRFFTRFYGLTVMPTEIQRIIDLILANEKNVFAFIDDILIVTKGSKENNLEPVEQILDKMNKTNARLKADKCVVAATSIHC